MSDSPQNVGTTLTGGIQDLSALLPLLGTNQIENHVGSALDGGFLYAAAAPLSLFGSLGIVKIGISVLISSISIPTISFSYPKFSINCSQGRWLGARTLNNAGFEPVGAVAPLIAMDGTRYMAETRLLQIFEEKHIDNPENLSIEWKSREWNIALVAFTIVAGVFSVTPYIDLLLQNSGPSAVHTPWIFPLLRTVGSCLAVICCQFLIQFRVISLMKNRIIFMVMHHVLVDDLKFKHDKPELDLAREDHLRWDMDLPAEQCLGNLEHFLSSLASSTQPSDTGPDELGEHISIEMKKFSFSDPEHFRARLQQLHDEHFPTPAFNRALILISWTILCLSLPATVAGYIGCFTLVSDSQKHGPLIWLGLEAALSIIRILIWAWNPGFDENTDITVKVKLTEDQPLVTTEKNVEVIESTGNNTLALVPERRFLEWITPYTGPLEQFRSSENLALYFTLAASGLEHKCLYMTVFDLNKRIAVTLRAEKEGLGYVDTAVTYNHMASEMEALLQSAIGTEHLWRTNEVVLFDALADYYKCIMHALNRTHLDSPASDNLQPDFMPTPGDLRWKWNLLPKHTTSESNNQRPDQTLGSPTEHDRLYLCRGHEHHLKTKLIENWSNWIIEDMNNLRSDARNDCHHALADAASDKAKWELTELDSQLALEWTRRELALVVSSITLEGILRQRMEKCVNTIAEDRGDQRLKEWMSSEFVVGQRKRLEKEKGQARERVEKEMKVASERAEREGRLWRNQGFFNPQNPWEVGLKFIDEQWAAAIQGGHLALGEVVSHLNELVKRNAPRTFSGEMKTRLTFVEQIMQRFEHWRPQRENEWHSMDATIKRLSDADSEQDYQYPQPDLQDTGKFVTLRPWQSQARVCSATVYDVEGRDKEVICDIIKKSTTRSVIGVDPALVDSIPENDHLIYISSPSGKEPLFIQRNRELLWNRLEQTSGNSSTFYFSPQGVSKGGQCVFSQGGTISHIFIFLATPSCLRLHLLHRRYRVMSVSIRENSKELRRISTNEIPKELRLQGFELDWFEPGRHELELVVSVEKTPTRDPGRYFLRDILIEFFNGSSSLSRVDKHRGKMATIVEHGGADAERGGIQDTDMEEVLLPAVENELLS